VDLATAALACGFASAAMVRTAAELPALRKAIHGAPGPVFAQVKVTAEKLPLVLPPREGVLLKTRFRRALLGAASELD
jgi:hypothetical protein